MKCKIGIACIVTGILLVIAALSLFLWNLHEEKQAEKSVEEALPKVIEQIKPRLRLNRRIQGNRNIPIPTIRK